MGSQTLMAAASTGGNESALAQIDVPMSGNIVGVQWVVLATLNATEESLRVELSFSSTVGFTNDSRNIISIAGVQAGVITAVGAVTEYITQYHGPMVVPVSMGERIFLHTSASAGVVGVINCLISFDFDLDRPLARRR